MASFALLILMPPLLTKPIMMKLLVMLLKLMIMILTLMVVVAVDDYGDDIEGTMGTDDHHRVKG